jgi:hypothetical protein
MTTALAPFGGEGVPRSGTGEGVAEPSHNKTQQNRESVTGRARRVNYLTAI